MKTYQEIAALEHSGMMTDEMFDSLCEEEKDMLMTVMTYDNYGPEADLNNYGYNWDVHEEEYPDYDND